MSDAYKAYLKAFIEKSQPNWQLPEDEDALFAVALGLADDHPRTKDGYDLVVRPRRMRIEAKDSDPDRFVFEMICSVEPPAAD